MINLDFIKSITEKFINEEFPNLKEKWDLVVLNIRNRPVVRFYKKGVKNRRENFMQLWLRKKFNSEEEVKQEIKDFLIRVNTTTASENTELKLMKEALEKAIDYSINYSIKEFKLAFQVQKQIEVVGIKDYIITLTISIFGNKNILKAILTSNSLDIKYNFEYLDNKECMDYLEFVTFLVITFNEEFEKLKREVK